MRHYVFLLFLALTSVCNSKAATVADSIHAVLPTLKGEARCEAFVDLYLYYYAQGNVEKALEMVDTLIVLRQRQGDVEREGNARWSRVAILNNAARFEDLAVEAENQMAWFKAHGIWNRYYQVWQRKCSSYYDLGKVQTSLREAKLMHADALERHNSIGSAMAYKQMGLVYYDLRQYEQAHDAFSQSISLMNQVNDSTGMLSGLYDFKCKALNQLKRYDRELETTDVWLSYLELVAEKHGMKLASGPFSSAYIARATALQGLGRTMEADKSLAKAEYYNNLYPMSLSQYYIYTLHMELSLERGQYETTLAYADSVEQMGEVFDDKMYLLKAKALVKSGRAAEAVSIYEELFANQDSLYGRDMRMQLDELNTLFKVDELKMQGRLERSSYVIGIIVLTLIVVLTLLFYFYMRYRASKRLQYEHQLLMESNDKLERSYEELQKANARATESTKMKEEFIKNISHEIRTPLNILNGFAQVLAMEGVELSKKEVDEARKNISENTNRITRLVSKMLELSEAGSHVAFDRNDEVSIQQIALQAAQTLQMDTLENVKFHLDIPQDLNRVMIKTDTKHAVRVLSLLLGNAKKFTKEGSITLSVAVQSDDNKQLAFIIEDTGMGIPATEAEHIFEEFVQLDQYTDGTGIGLTVARSIARRLGGDVMLDTSYTDGARFIYTLPL